LRDGSDRAWSIEFGTAYRDIWRDPLFRKAHARSKGRTVVSIRRKMNLYLIVRFYLAKLAGRNIIELGTWRGGNLLFMATILKKIDPTAKVYGLDTFAGMPETDKAVDLHRLGDFKDSNMDDILEAASAANLDNIELIKGDVRETLFEACNRASFGLAHIDLDIYDPIRFAQFELIKRMVPGGYLVYDDALTSTCAGATIAVEELIRSGKSVEQIYPHFVFRA
jgi:predicted O-methyltransferase YrrM